MKNVAGVRDRERESRNLNKKETSIGKCFINNENNVEVGVLVDPLKDKKFVYFYPFLYAKKHTEFY